MQTLTVNENEAGQRLDKLLAKYLSLAPRSFLYKMMRKKNITLNGKRCEGPEMLKLHDEIRLFLSDETIGKFSRPLPPSLWEAGNAGGKIKGAKKGPKGPDVIYEDAHILIVNKPSGMLSQKAKDSDYSLVEEIINYLVDSGHIPVSQLSTFRPSVCNRLDRNTSGLVVAGKSLAGLQVMSEAFHDRSIHKYYQCIVAGKLEEKQVITGFLTKNKHNNQVSISSAEREGSAPIMTEYVPLASNDRYTLLEVTLITGRTHQIRAHLASIGHPIIGDRKYGREEENQEASRKYGIRCQLLHSWKLVMPQLPEPLGYLKGKTFSAPLPPAFAAMAVQESLKGRDT